MELTHIMEPYPDALPLLGLKPRSGIAVLALLTAVTCRAEPMAPAALQACTDCHGANGVAAKAGTPHLNGQLQEFLAQAMSRFSSGRRSTAVPQHKALAPADVDAVAAFYASQKAAARPSQKIDAAVSARGERVYNERCADCHVDAGRDSDKDAPLLAGQEKEFLVAQTLLFKTGARKFPFKMDDAYRGLSDDDLKAVAEYFAAQSPVAAEAPGKKKHRR
jgi:sulfide dehydrogenase cytochrome subunit